MGSETVAKSRSAAAYKSLEGTASGGVVRKPHGCGPGPKIRFDIHDRGLPRRKGAFQRRADIGGGLNIFTMATKGIHELFIPLVAQLASDLSPLRVGGPATIQTDHRHDGQIVPYCSVHLHGV